jgi:hypothetical protein
MRARVAEPDAVNFSYAVYLKAIRILSQKGKRQKGR